MKKLFGEIKNIKILQKEDIHRLFKSFHDNNDLEAKKYLVYSHLYLVVNILENLDLNEEELEYLFEQGYITLDYAVNNYDVSRGLPFKTYLYYFLNERLFFRKNYFRERYAKRNFITLGNSVYEENFCKYFEVDSSAEEYAVSNITNIETTEILNKLIDDNLSCREAMFIRYMFGLNCDKITLKQIALDFNVNLERATYIYKKALKKLINSKNNSELLYYR